MAVPRILTVFVVAACLAQTIIFSRPQQQASDEVIIKRRGEADPPCSQPFWVERTAMVTNPWTNEFADPADIFVSLRNSRNELDSYGDVVHIRNSRPGAILYRPSDTMTFTELRSGGEADVKLYINQQTANRQPTIKEFTV